MGFTVTTGGTGQRVGVSSFFDSPCCCCLFFSGVAPLKPEFSGPKEKIVPIPDGSSFFILGKKNW